MSRTYLVVLGALLVACSSKRSDSSPAKAETKVEPPAVASVEAKAPIPDAVPASVDTPAPPAGMSPESSSAKPAEPLTADEQKLIDSDPKDLTRDERRARAFALRKKIMQNPDSPAARALEDLRKAAEAGELGPPPDFAKDRAAEQKQGDQKSGMWVDVNGKRTDYPPPAGTIK